MSAKPFIDIQTGDLVSYDDYPRDPGTKWLMAMGTEDAGNTFRQLCFVATRNGWECVEQWYGAAFDDEGYCVELDKTGATHNEFVGAMGGE